MNHIANSNLRIFWIIWCCGWAVFWFFSGFFTFLLGWLGVPFSLLMILIPVGITPVRQIPPVSPYQQIPPPPDYWQDRR